MHLRDNHTDLSTETGFQFEFHCERCRDAWRSPFDRYAVGTVESVLQAASGLFGGFFGTAAEAAGHVRGAGWHTAHDTALKQAVQLAGSHFHRCVRCQNHFCDACWNEEEGACIDCVPRLDAELATIRREAKLQRAREVAYERASVSDADLKDRVVGCPSCGKPAGRGKFCAECGEPLALTVSCRSCEAEIPRTSKFCPECGEPAR
jgi:hypothetical protein